jgi:anti-anti-sigma regulatory factor
MTGATEHGPASVAAGRGRAAAITDPTAPGMPTTLTLRGAIDILTAPGLGAMVATAADTGHLLIDASAVDRFDSATWAALTEGCAGAVEAGGEVQVTGLRWTQVLDVLAATPVMQVAALMAGMRALRSQPDHHPPATASTRGADVTPRPREPGPRPPPPGVGPSRPRTKRPMATEATTDHLPRDWTLRAPGARRG